MVVVIILVISLAVYGAFGNFDLSELGDTSTGQWQTPDRDAELTG